MKAKHFLYVLPASLCFLASCSDEMEGQSTAMDNTIQVNAMIASQLGTDARAVTSAETTTANLKSFYLTAYNEEHVTQGALIDGTKFVRQSNSKWTDGKTYYWPLDEVRFIALAASDESKLENFTVTNDNITATGFTVEPSGADNFVEQKDYVAAVKDTYKPEDSNVIGLNFQHLISRISVDAYAPNYSENKVSFAAVAFDGVNVSGDFARENTETNMNIAPSCWSNQENGNVGAYYDGEHVESVWYHDEVFKIGKAQPQNATRLSYSGMYAPWLNVIPGTNVADKLHLSVWTDHECYDLVLDIPENLVTEYKPGYQYIYNVIVIGQDLHDGEKIRPEIEIKGVTVMQWNPEGVEESKVENNVEHGKALKTLMENAKTYETVNMVQDVICHETITVQKDINLNLEGFSLKNTADVLFSIKEGGKLRILGSGLVDVASAENLVSLEGNGKLILKGGTYKFDPSAFCHAQYEAVKQGEGEDARWTVQLKEEPTPETKPEPEPEPEPEPGSEH